MDEHDADAELEALLGRALASADPVPAHVHDGALAAFAFRDLDASLAELIEEEAGALRDGDGGAGQGPLVFATSDVEIAIDLSGTRCVGQIAPDGSWQGRVDQPGSRSVDLDIDEVGRFSIDLRTGPARIVVQQPDGTAYRTDWFQI